MFGDEEYDENKYPEALRLSPRVQVMEKYPRYSPDDGSLPRCFCCKVCAYGLCGPETEGFGPGKCVFGCVLCCLKIFMAQSGNHVDATFNRPMLMRMHAVTKPSAYKGFIVKDIVIPSRDAARRIPARICCKEEEDVGNPERHRKPVLLYLQGGGFCQGNNKDTGSTKMMTKLAEALDIVCIGINYRLAPENPFPAGLQDVYDFMKWVANDATTSPEVLSACPIDLDKVMLFGESAGANFALVASTLWRDGVNAELEGSDELKGMKIIAQVIDYPTLCLPYPTPSSYTQGRNLVVPFYQMRWYRDSYLPEDKRAELFKDRRVCPLRTSMDGLPDTLHMYVGYDPLVDENHRLAEVLEASTTNAVSKFYPQHVHGVFALVQGADPEVSQFAFVVKFLAPLLEGV